MEDRDIDVVTGMNDTGQLVAYREDGEPLYPKLVGSLSLEDIDGTYSPVLTMTALRLSSMDGKETEAAVSILVTAMAHMVAKRHKVLFRLPDAKGLSALVDTSSGKRHSWTMVPVPGAGQDKEEGK